MSEIFSLDSSGSNVKKVIAVYKTCTRDYEKQGDRILWPIR